VKIWKKIDHVLESILAAMAIFASALVFVIMLIITVDVLSRLLFNHPFAGVAEIVSLMIIIFTFLVLPHVTARNGHVRTTMFYDKVNRNGKLIIDILACIIGIVVYAFIIKASYKGFINAINIGEAEIAGSVRISTVPGRFCIIFGSSMMILEMINKTVKYMYSLITQKDFDQGGMADEGGNLG